MKEQEIDFSVQINDLKDKEEESTPEIGIGSGMVEWFNWCKEEGIENVRMRVDEAIDAYGLDKKTDVIESFYDNDPKPVLDELKQILIAWQEKDYPDDETQWKAYFEDILTLVHRRTYNSRHDG
jgi:hypothetical protein